MGLFSCFGTLFVTKKSTVYNESLTRAHRQKTLASASIKIKELALQEFIAHFNTVFKSNIFTDNLELDIDKRVRTLILHLKEQSDAYDKKGTLHHALEPFYFFEVQSLKNLLPENATPNEPYVYKLIRNATEATYKTINFSWTQTKEIRKLIKATYKQRHDEHHATKASALALPSMILQTTLHPFATLSQEEFDNLQTLLVPFTRDERWNNDPIFQECQKKIFLLNDNDDYTQIQFTAEEKDLWSKISLEYSLKKLPDDVLALPALHTLLLQKNPSEKIEAIRTANYAIQILESLPSSTSIHDSNLKTLTQTLISSYGYSCVYAGKFAALVKQFSMQFFVDYTSIENMDITHILHGTAEAERKAANTSNVLWKIFTSEAIISGKIWEEEPQEPINDTEECNSTLDLESLASDLSAKSENLELTRVPCIDAEKEKALENTRQFTETLFQIANKEKDILNSENPHKNTFNGIYTQATAQFARYFSGYPRFNIPQNANIYTLLEKLNEYCKANQAANSNSPFMNTDTYRLKTAQYAIQVLNSLLDLAASPANKMQDHLKNVMLNMVIGHNTAQSHLSKFSRYIKGESSFASVISSTCKMFNQNPNVKQEVTALMQAETTTFSQLKVTPSFKRLNSLLDDSSATSKSNTASAA